MFRSLSKHVKPKLAVNGSKKQSYAKDRLVEEDYQVIYDEKFDEDSLSCPLFDGIQRSTDQKVQIRICHKESPKLADYQFEVMICQKMDHPNVLKILDVYEDEMYYIYVQNTTTEGQEIQRIFAK